MAGNFPYFLADGEKELPYLRKCKNLFLALGLAMIVIGTLAIGYPVVATLLTVEFIGVLLIVAGIVEIVSCIWARRLGSFLQHIVCGLLYLFLGVVMLDRPLLAATGYTLVMAFFFFAAGLFRVAFGLSQRFSGWGWVVLSGSISLILGVMIWRDLPEAALWVIGTFVGIDLLFNGWSWVMLGLAARNILTETKFAEERAQLAKV
jgi:uncharacterized membrane protein HdeD (DUF308 family)